MAVGDFNPLAKGICKEEGHLGAEADNINRGERLLWKGREGGGGGGSLFVPGGEAFVPLCWVWPLPIRGLLLR